MGFPFIKPFEEYIKDKLNKRSAKGFESYGTNKPFVILSSPYIVTQQKLRDEKGETSIENIKAVLDIKNTSIKKYNGCKIKNELNAENLYPTGSSYIGYDFDGKKIEVFGEVNRRLPPPIIESVEVNTDGDNNTLKSAKLKIKIFTLKQLEMFELFFLRAGAYSLVEFGSQSLKNEPNGLAAIISNNNFENFLKEYKKNFSKDNANKGLYQKKISDSKGYYDYIAGTVTEFSYTIAENLTYNIDLTISSSNTMLYFLPPAPKKKSSKTSQQNIENKTFSNWINKIQAELNITIPAELKEEKKYKNEFFNWNVKAELQSETKVSIEPYLSMRYILELLNGSGVLPTAEKMVAIDTFKDDKGNSCIPCETNLSGSLISYSTDLIIPGDIPQITMTEKKDEIIFVKDNSKKVKSYPINGYVFNTKGFKVEQKKGTSLAAAAIQKKIEAIPNKQYGNILNLFINYNTFSLIWNRSSSKIEILNQLLELVNENMFGLTKLKLGNETENDTVATIKDLCISQEIPKPLDLYRFKIGPSGSIVKGFEFTFNLDDLQMGQAFFANISNANKIINGKPEEKIILDGNNSYSYTNTGYTQFDTSIFANADGFVSLDKANYEIQLQNKADIEKRKNELGTKDLVESPTNTKKEEATKEDKDVTESLNSKSVKFKLGKEIVTLIYKDKPFITGGLDIKTNEKKKTSALTFLEISVVISGTSGISCGEIFRMDGIPEVYNKNGFFQITNVKHTLDKEGWKTLLEAGYRINNE